MSWRCCDEIFVQAYLDQNFTHKGKGLFWYNDSSTVKRGGGGRFKKTSLWKTFEVYVTSYYQYQTHLVLWVLSMCRYPSLLNYTRKNAQVDAMLMKTGLNNVLLPTLFIAVNNIEQYCYTRFRLNNIVQYCWQVWTTWAAKHCSVLLSNGLGVFLPCTTFSFSQVHHQIDQNVKCIIILIMRIEAISFQIY
jgi:hypothetical protein